MARLTSPQQGETPPHEGPRMFGVGRGPLKFCSIECARHNGVEPSRMLMLDEYEGQCAGCLTDLEDV